MLAISNKAWFDKDEKKAQSDKILRERDTRGDALRLIKLFTRNYKSRLPTPAVEESIIF